MFYFYIMRHLNYSNLEKVFKKYPKYKDCKIFVETGTFLGGTIIPMAKQNHFKKLYTIEIDKATRKKAIKKAKNDGITNVEFILGDSALELSKLVDRMPKEPAVFFLDGHYTFSRKSSTGRGIVDVPLLYEIEAIVNKRNCDDLIIIDDIRIMGKEKSSKTANADWTNVSFEKIFNLIPFNRMKAHFEDDDYNHTPGKEYNDRYYILLKAN